MKINLKTLVTAALISAGAAVAQPVDTATTTNATSTATPSPAPVTPTAPEADSILQTPKANKPATNSPAWTYSAAHGARLDTVARVTSETLGTGFDAENLLVQWHAQLKQLSDQAGKIRLETLSTNAEPPATRPTEAKADSPEPANSIADVAALLRLALQKLESASATEPVQVKTAN